MKDIIRNETQTNLKKYSFLFVLKLENGKKNTINLHIQFNFKY
jgi:hypothetical protein